MKRGEVWTANLNPNKGAEVGKIRPVVILQDDRLIATGLPTILALPLTTQFRPAQAPMRVRIEARDRLQQTCYVMVEQPRDGDRQDADSLHSARSPHRRAARLGRHLIM
jgi:mRNA interferase MazF